MSPEVGCSNCYRYSVVSLFEPKNPVPNLHGTGFFFKKLQTDTLRFFPLFSRTDAIADPGLREDVARVVGVVA